MGFFGPSKNEISLNEENATLKAEIYRLSQMLTPEQQEREKIALDIANMKQSLANTASQVNQLYNRIVSMNTEIECLNKEIAEKKRIISIYDIDIDVQEYGLYKPTFAFANSDLYKDRLNQIRDAQKICVKNDSAALGNTNWQVNGSAAKGRTMVNDTKKLLLRAFNVECDDMVANVKTSNLERSIERIYKISGQISKLGKTMAIEITPRYIQLKIEEVKLALDYQQKKQEERERQKELRAQEREEAKVLKEIEEERKRLKKGHTH